MTITKAIIPDQLCAELHQYLDAEDEFLLGVERCAARLGEHPVGKAFTNELIEDLLGVQKDVGSHNIRRATLQKHLATKLAVTPSAVHLSAVAAASDATRRLQTRRREVLQKALSVEARLRHVLSQLTESNVIVTAVLESVLSAPVDRSRYDSEGKPIQQFSQLKSQRVA